MDFYVFHYKIWYILFPIGPIDMKLTECTKEGMINIHTKFEVFSEKIKFFMELWHFS